MPENGITNSSSAIIVLPKNHPMHPFLEKKLQEIQKLSYLDKKLDRIYKKLKEILILLLKNGSIDQQELENPGSTLSQRVFIAIGDVIKRGSPEDLQANLTWAYIAEKSPNNR